MSMKYLLLAISLMQSFFGFCMERPPKSNGCCISNSYKKNKENTTKPEERRIRPKVKNLRPCDYDLLNAAAAGDLKGIENALGQGASMFAVDGEGRVKGYEECPRRNRGVLHYAVISGNVDCVNKILDYALSTFGETHYDEFINATDSLNETALHAARSNDIICLLLNAGLDIDAQDSTGNTLLHDMVANREIVQLLISRGANRNLVNQQGMMPFHNAVMEGHWQTLRLLATPDNINYRNAEGLTAIHLSDEPKVIATLIELGVNVYAQHVGGVTALQYAAFHGNNLVASLLEVAGEASC